MKKVWRILRKVAIITAGLLTAVIFMVVLTSAVQQQNRLTCKDLKIKIDYDSGLAFLNVPEITERVNFLSGGSLVNKVISDIDFATLERELEKSPYVEYAEVYVNRHQVVVVEIFQKRPILRILNRDGVGYYLGERNERIPLSDKFTMHVPIALGNVEMHQSAKRDSVVQVALYNLVKYIRQDKFLHSLVDQIYVSETGEFDVIPKTGGHIIRVGNAEENMDEKFQRLKVFYSEGLKKVGWSKYRIIDLRYRNQVVCEKKDTTQITI